MARAFILKGSSSESDELGNVGSSGAILSWFKLRENTPSEVKLLSFTELKRALLALLAYHKIWFIVT